MYHSEVSTVDESVRVYSFDTPDDNSGSNCVELPLLAEWGDGA